MIMAAIRGSQTPSPDPPEGFTPVAAVTGEIIDGFVSTPKYPAFPWPCSLPDGSTLVGLKHAAEHADKYIYRLMRSIDGGATYPQNKQITVEGQDIECAALSLSAKPTSTGRVHITYQDDNAFTNGYYLQDYLQLSFAWIHEDDIINDFDTADFTDAGTITVNDFLGAPPAGSYWVMSPFSKPIELPEGTLLQAAYVIQVNSTTFASERSHIITFRSTDNGASWAYYRTVKDSDDAPWVGNIGGEPCLFIVEEGATDDDTKLCVIIRNLSTAHYMVNWSTDGGDTWTTDPVNYFYEFGNTSSPCHAMLYNGMVHIFNGTRKLGGSGPFRLEMATCSPEDMMTNNQAGYTLSDITFDVQANINGADIHWGYPEPYERKFPAQAIDELLVVLYDTSTLDAPGGDIVTRCVQIVISPAP